MRYRLVDRGNGLKEIKRDLKTGIIVASVIVPFPFLGLFSAPWWAWCIWGGWLGLLYYANRPKKKRQRKLDTFDLKKEDAA